MADHALLQATRELDLAQSPTMSTYIQPAAHLHMTRHIVLTSQWVTILLVQPLASIHTALAANE